MMESPMTRNCHVGFGERYEETHQSQDWKVRFVPTPFSPLLANIALNGIERIVDVSILPPNTVCCSYIKKQSISHLFNKVLEVMDHDDPGFGIFTLSFNREMGENGVYYSVDFDWRSRESEEEIKQLDLIAAFMLTYKEQLIDLEGTRDLTCVDGWTAQQLQALTAQRRELEGIENRRMSAA